MTANLLRQREDPTWLAATAEWVEQKLAERGIALTSSPAEVRVLPWSAVYRFPTMTGDVYFKACAPSQGFEPALMCYLAERRPGDVLPVLAADLGRAWLLMPDGGPVLSDVLQEDVADIARHWSMVLGRLADLQIDLSQDVGRLLALGVPDRRPEILPALYRELLARPERLLHNAPEALTADDLPKLRALLPRVEAVCAELAASGPPVTLVHDDLHDGHIFVRLGENTSYVFFDYGDACISHPFVQMVSAQRFWPIRSSIQPDHVTVEHLYGVYLSRWDVSMAVAERRRALDLALAVGTIVRALTWINAVGSYLDEVGAELRARYARGVAYWMRALLERVDGLDGG